MESKKPSPESTRLRSGLTQYVGAFINSMEGDKDDIGQLVTAALAEEALNACIKDNKYDQYRAKPILRAANVILAQRVESMKKLAAELPDELAGAMMTQVKSEQAAVDTITNIINATKKKGK